MNDSSVVDSSKKFSMKKGVLSVLGKNAPNSGFNRIIILFALISIVSYFYFRSGEEEAVVIHTSQGDGFNDRGAKSSVVSESIAKEEVQKDHVAAEESRGEGDSYFGVRPSTGKQSIKEVLDNLKPKPKEPEKTQDERTEPVQTPVFKSNLGLDSATNTYDRRTPSKARNNGLTPMQEYLKGRTLNESESAFSNGVLVVYEAPEDLKSEEGSAKSSSSTGVSQDQSTASANPDDDLVLAQRAGYFAYAVTLTAADTDVAIKEIVSEILGGPLDGARLIGTWSRLGNFYEDLSLKFTSMEFEGEVYSVNLIAFSPSTHLPAFVSEVDRHLLYRWGGLLSGAALEGAKTAALAAATISDPEATDALVNATSDLSGEDIRNIFISEGGSEIAQTLSDQFDRPITSKVYVNQDMRLLAVEPIYVKRKN